MFKDQNAAAGPFVVDNPVLENDVLQNLIVLGGFGAVFLVIILAHRSVPKDRSGRDENSPPALPNATGPGTENRPAPKQ